MHRHPDLRGIFRLAPHHPTAVPSGARPAHRIYDDYLSSGEHVYPEASAANPGEAVLTEVWLVAPEACPESIWPGREIQVTSGSRPIGTLVVEEVCNPVLFTPSPIETTRWPGAPG